MIIMCDSKSVKGVGQPMPRITLTRYRTFCLVKASGSLIVEWVQGVSYARIPPARRPRDVRPTSKALASLGRESRGEKVAAWDLDRVYAAEQCEYGESLSSNDCTTDRGKRRKLNWMRPFIGFDQPQTKSHRTANAVPMYGISEAAVAVDCPGGEIAPKFTIRRQLRNEANQSPCSRLFQVTRGSHTYGIRFTPDEGLDGIGREANAMGVTPWISRSDHVDSIEKIEQELKR